MSDRREILAEALRLLAAILAIAAGIAAIIFVLLHLLGTWPTFAVTAGVPFLWLVWLLAAISVENRKRP